MKSPTKVRILVVEDDPAEQKLMTVLLKRAGMQLLNAVSAAEAAQFLIRKPLPDLVVLDLMLPGVSEIEFLKQLRAKSTFNNLPVIILTALADPELIRQALEAGANRYLTKPFLTKNLVQSIREVLHERG